jgi:hypothetical protein
MSGFCVQGLSLIANRPNLTLAVSRHCRSFRRSKEVGSTPSLRVKQC